MDPSPETIELPDIQVRRNRLFASFFRVEPYHESKASCIVFIMKICFHSFANKTVFHMKLKALHFSSDFRNEEEKKKRKE